MDGRAIIVDVGEESHFTLEDVESFVLEMMSVVLRLTNHRRDERVQRLDLLL